MALGEKRTDRRADALSKRRIVEAAIDILDTDGERSLTFRVLATHLSTGPGAIYHHVADKDDLLAAATDFVIARSVRSVVGDAGPQHAIRAVTLAVFDAIDTHPWVGAQLSREPWQPAVLMIFEGIGSRLRAIGVPEAALFDAASALLSYVLGLAGQYAAGARLMAPDTNRETFLRATAESWARLDPAEYPFVRSVAAQLPTHDDREQFLAGIDVILTGITALIAPVRLGSGPHHHGV